MMVDDEIDLLGRVGKVRGLEVHDSDLLKCVKTILSDLFDFNFQKLHHRDVFRPRHTAEGSQRRGLLVPSENLSKRQAARDGVRIRVVLKEN
jgi:hypothetical protein